MRNRRVLLLLFVFAVYCGFAGAAVEKAGSDKDFEERIKESLVYINVTANAYESFQPWKKSSVAEKRGYGCAVGEYEVLTTASNVSDATFAKVRRPGQNEFISADIKVVDFESNLCLLKLDKESMDKPLVPLVFSEDYEKGADVSSYQVTAGGHLTTGRGVLDRAEVNVSTMSFGQFLDFVIAEASSNAGKATLYCLGEKPIGIANWAAVDSKEVGLVPGVIINKFLKDAGDGEYKGFPSVGFSATKLIDPATRRYLKMPEDLKDGIYVTKVFTLGTGSDVLKEGDSILSIDGHTLDAYGRFTHPVFDQILYHHLISGHRAGDDIKLGVWREGQKVELTARAKNIDASDMLVDYYEYGKQPEYIVVGGFVLQKLTRPYLKIWGDGWQGKAPPHLYHYYRDMAFNPTDERKDVVVLSFVMPAEINQGYHSLGRQVVSKINGTKIRRMSDIPKALDASMMVKFHTIELEHDYPTVVIDRSKLEMSDRFIAKTYGVSKMANINYE